MTTLETRICPGCGATFPFEEGQGDRYGVASPECFAALNKVLAKEYELSGRSYPPIHRLTVDAYAVQHPPHHERQVALNISEQ